MQIVSNGDNLYEMSKPVLWEKQEKISKCSSAEFFTQSAKGLSWEYEQPIFTSLTFNIFGVAVFFYWSIQLMSTKKLYLIWSTISTL